MHSNNIQFGGLLLVLLLCGVKSDLRKCGEFNEENFDIFPYQNELEHIFDAFDKSNDQEVEQVLKKLKNIELLDSDEEDSEEYKNDPIKYVPDRIKAEGYPSEVHEVVTDDGYILELHRVPYGKKSPQTDQTRPPIFLMNPLLESSNCWVVLGPDHSLAYLLADAGYDVWMGNARGTEVSRRHVRLPTTGPFQKKHWSFSLHEIGFYDTPAFIDHILSTTNHTKLNYIRFSQSGATFLIMTSMRPEYNDKIIEAQLMAPAAFFKVNHNRFIDSLERFYKPLKGLFEAFKIYKLTLNNKLASTIATTACRKATNSTPFPCKIIMTLFDSNQINCTSLKNILVATPAGASIRQGLHYIQFIRSKGFNQFDYDSKILNRRMYGRETPPPYDSTKITTPINLYYSKDDHIVAAENMIELQSQLKSLKSTYVVPIDDFAHVDFIYSRFIRKAINDKLLIEINKTNQIN